MTNVAEAVFKSRLNSPRTAYSQPPPDHLLSFIAAVMERFLGNHVITRDGARQGGMPLWILFSIDQLGPCRLPAFRIRAFGAPAG